MPAPQRTRSGDARVRGPDDREPSRPPVRDTHVQQLLALQRTAGNHAVTVALSTRRSRTLARALVDFGVQAHLGDRQGANGSGPTPVVAALDIGGRPHGLFGAKHRSHTTAWVVFCDVVRTAVLYQPLPDAIQRLQALIDEALTLPGAAPERLEAMKQDVQVTGANARTGFAIYDKARRDAAAAKALGASALAPGGAGVAVAAIQELAAAYLQLRNATPLSVTHDVTVAQGHGEGGAHGGLRAAEREGDDERSAAAEDRAATEVTEELAEAERAPAAATDAHVRSLLWKLLDLKAVGFLVRTEPSGQQPRTHSPVPGNVPGESAARRLADTVAQHLLTIRRAFPALYQRADMHGEASLRDRLGPDADAVVDSRGATVLTAIRERLGLPFVAMAPGAAAGVHGVAAPQRGAVQITVEDRNGQAHVKTVRIGSRPTGILGNEEGAHLTAFGLVAEALKRVIEGCPLASVPDRMDTQLQLARDLPAARRRDALKGQAATRYDAADRAATDALARARSTPPTDVAYVAVLQELLSAFLRYRNTLPLAATIEGGVPGGKAEGVALATLRAAEERYRAAEQAAAGGQAPMDIDPDPAVLDAMWALVDSGAIGAIMTSTSKIRAPGIRRPAPDDETFERIGDIVGTHVRTVKNAFPKCAAKHQVAGQDSIVRFLTGKLPRLGTTDAALARQDEALVLGKADARRVAKYIATGTLPAPVAEDTRARRRSTRVSKRTRTRPDELGETDWVELEEEEETEAEQIVRPKVPVTKKRK
jgi:hypothetical protein